jgi:hypothetical protein
MSLSLAAAATCLKFTMNSYRAPTLNPLLIALCPANQSYFSIVHRYASNHSPLTPSASGPQTVQTLALDIVAVHQQHVNRASATWLQYTLK